MPLRQSLPTSNTTLMDSFSLSFTIPPVATTIYYWQSPPLRDVSSSTMLTTSRHFFLILTPSLHISLSSTFLFFASSSFLRYTQQSPYPHQLLPPSITASDTPVVTTTSLAIQHADPMHHDCLYMSTLLCPSFLMLFKKWVRWFFLYLSFISTIIVLYY